MRRILIVDSELEIMQLFAEEAQAAGLSVTMTNEMAVGLEIAKLEYFDYLVLDPGRNFDLLMNEIGPALENLKKAWLFCCDDELQDKFIHRQTIHPKVTFLEKPCDMGALLQEIRNLNMLKAL